MAETDERAAHFMKSDVEVEGIGTMSHLGHSRHWEGEVTPTGTDEPIYLNIDGTSDGPSLAQVRAVGAALATWPAILADAEEGLTALLRESGLPVMAPWEAFRVEGISVPAETYEAPDRIHLLVDLAHVDHPDEFLPAIDVVDGTVIEVLSGT